MNIVEHKSKKGHRVLVISREYSPGKFTNDIKLIVSLFLNGVHSERVHTTFAVGNKILPSILNDIIAGN